VVILYVHKHGGRGVVVNVWNYCLFVIKCFRKMSSPNAHKICRLCMSQTGVMVHIFEANETKEQSIPLPIRIMMCVSIKVSLIPGECIKCVLIICLYEAL
jgi:hypothetical protein